MSKPDDIPQDIWEAATEAVRESFGDPLAPMAPYLARAILAERERAARIVEAECERVLSKQNGKDYAVDANLRLIAVVLPDLAAAIRLKAKQDHSRNPIKREAETL